MACLEELGFSGSHLKGKLCLCRKSWGFFMEFREPFKRKVAFVHVRVGGFILSPLKFIEV